jgi:hypothetical protein
MLIYIFISHKPTPLPLVKKCFNFFQKCWFHQLFFVNIFLEMLVWSTIFCQHFTEMLGQHCLCASKQSGGLTGGAPACTPEVGALRQQQCRHGGVDDGEPQRARGEAHRPIGRGGATSRTGGDGQGWVEVE